MLSDVFIRRPILATVCSLLIILAGAICIPLLPIARYPALAPPSVIITAFYTGANAQAVESAVTTPLEQAVNGVEGMTYIQSSSTNSGVSTINVFFEIERDPDLAAVDVQNRVNQVLGRLPADVRTTGVTVTKNTAGFMGGLGFFAKDNRYSAQFISNYLDLYVRDAIKRVPGVGNVIIFGERKYAMRLWLDPARLAARRITAGDVVRALREQNLQVAAGALGDAPADADQMYSLSVRARGRLTEVAQFENVVVKAGAGTSLVRVRDIGRVELGAETYSSNLRFIGLEASGMGIQLLPKANALAVYQGVMKEMARLEKSFPPGLEWRLAFDNVSVVRESIKEVLITLLEAIALVILVMFLFLQNWRSTLIPAITIPVSLIGTFAFVKLFGFSINTLTLFGIVLATGIVVDDAIVVIENIERHMAEEKKSSYRAAIDAMREVFGAVMVIGLVLVAVFVPVAFFPGTTGRLYQQFSLTIAFAVILSVFNAVTFTPALSALLLAKESHTHGRFFTAVNRVIDGGTSGYVRLLKRAPRPAAAHARPLRTGPAPDRVAVQDRALRLRARRGRGLLHHRDPGARRRLPRVHDQHRQAGGGHPLQGPRHPGRLLGGGLQLQRRGPQQRPDLHPAQGLPRAAGQGPFARGRARPGPRSHDGYSGGPRHPLRAPGHPGPVGVRRLPVRAPRPDGGRHLGTGGHPRRVREARQRERPGGGALLELPRHRPPARGGHRPRQGPEPGPAPPGGHGRPPGVPGLRLRERLRLQQPGLSRLRAGRPAVPRQPERPAAALRPGHERRHGPPGQRGAHEGDHGPPGHQPLQPVPLGGDQRRARAGVELRRRAPGHGAALPGGPAPRASTSPGRASPWRRRRRAPRWSTSSG